MKRYLTFTLILLGWLATANEIHAQIFGNEWINYGQSYAKFSVHENGMYRVTYSELVGAGITSPNGTTIQLIREGKQIPIFVSSVGAFGVADYIEFYAEKANGQIDEALYLDPTQQMNKTQNLISDTAFYFITQSSTGPYLRFSQASNTISGSPVKEPYIWDVSNTNFRGALSQGPSYIGQSDNPINYIRSSQFERAEGWVNNFSFNAQALSVNLSNPFKGAGAPSLSIKTTVAGFSYLSLHRVRVEVNGSQLAEETFPAFSSKEFSMSAPASLLGLGNSLNFNYTPLNSQPGSNLFDRVGIANVNVRFAASLDMTGVSAQYFELDPKAGNYYLEFDNMNVSAGPPRLYDLDAQEFYVANIAVPGKVRFLIPSSGGIKKLFLLGAQASAPKMVNKLQPISFKNYTLSANQGDYIIITHPYYFDGAGTNYVENYKIFRSSINGGGYQAIVANIEDIYNEFGYGYNFHAQAIRNYLHFSNKSSLWSSKSKFAFIIGKGILYTDYVAYSNGRLNNPANYPYVPIPTFGIPASDIMLTDFNNDNIPELPIGRLSVLNGSAIGPYLDKVQLHESRLLSTSQQFVDSVLWMKQYLHVAGADDINIQAPILSALNRQGETVRDTLYGAVVSTFAKSSTAAVQQEATEAIDRIVNKGAGFIQFFGHGSLSTLDFGGFDNVSLYEPNNRYSIFMANGCGVGNVFGLGSVRSLSESWNEIPNRGGIGYIANSNTGYLFYLANYTDSLYKQFGKYNYGKTIGEQFVGNVINIFADPNVLNNNVIRLHAEQILLQGDPAVRMFGRDKPDYAVEDKYMRIRQVSVTTKLDSFDVDLVVYNLGKYTRDSLDLKITRILPNNQEEVVLQKRYNGIIVTDSLALRIPVGGKNALGINRLKVRIDDQSEIDEVAEYNNEIIRTFSVYNDDLEPVYPYEFSIVTEPNLTLKASTLNPFLESRQYVIQLDTTERFNSAALLTTRITSGGGLVKWTPAINLQNSTVYYWRTAMDTVYGNPEHRWTTSSFIYLPNANPGWNQSHYYQYLKDEFENIGIDSIQREFQFTKMTKKLQIQNVCLYGPNPYFYSWADYTAKINGVQIYDDGCDPWPRYESVQFIIIDSLTGLPWRNTQSTTNPNQGRFGSWKPCRIETAPGSGVFADPFFEFYYMNTAARQNIMNFLDSIPDGAYVMMQPRLCLSGQCGGLTTAHVNLWKNDTTVLGSGNSLYHKLKDFGFTLIDSFNKNRPMIFFMQKGDMNSVQQHIAPDSTVKLYKEFEFDSYLYEGKIISNKIGPAKQWGDFKRSGISLQPGQAGDTVSVEIFGISPDDNETLLAKVFGDTSLSFIDPVLYPNIRLVMNQKDERFSTPEQVKYWRVHFTPVPEAALNPNAQYAFVDTLVQGQKGMMKLAIENLTDLPMDSMLVKYSIIDENSAETIIGLQRYKPLGANDTLHATFEFDTRTFANNYLFKVEANPNKDQPEQYHPNNLGFKELFINPDNKNPLLDVTFDGIHILNRDIVSAKPTILITLKDENDYLPLDDTSAMQIFLRYPDNPNVDVPIGYDNPTLTFIPANPSNQGENKARVEFTPTFLNDGIYELVVKGKDKIGNQSGTIDYKIAFTVITKSSITSVLNYPNPFSTQTQFVFTLTGNQVPEQFKIQIYNMSGKVVREISKAEIGHIHIGRNITEFRWKGDDQYGDLLGNGVYLYRVVTRLNGQEMDKAENDAASKWTDKGFGKLYIMR